MSDTEIRVRAIQDEALEIVRQKNGNYGSSWRNQGWLGNTSRILEKSDRLRAMLWNNSQPLLNGSKEHPRETMLDLMNTLAFAIVNMDDGVERGNEPQAKEILGPWMAMTPRQSSLEEERRQYAFSIGKVVEQLFADEWPPHLRKETDIFSPGAQAVPIGPEATHGELPTPGEERQVGEGSGPRPSPVARKQSRGSRAVKDAPQA